MPPHNGFLVTNKLAPLKPCRVVLTYSVMVGGIEVDVAALDALGLNVLYDNGGV